MVVCAPPPLNPYYERDPCSAAEVLSPNTEAIDRGEKLWRHLSLPLLQVCPGQHPRKADCLPARRETHLLPGRHERGTSRP
ncbi:MAG: hypothetical protein P3W93_010475 [Thermus sp.]|nr:hypothetical protein [Thermus sp.]